MERGNASDGLIDLKEQKSNLEKNLGILNNLINVDVSYGSVEKVSLVKYIY